MNRRYSIQVSEKVYNSLREKGRFGESFTNLIQRILDELDAGGDK